MKNLFKNLMLVAVAAMAFTACTETNDEVNAVTKKVVLEFVADLADDDTRVAFGEKDGDKYPTVWEAYDNVTVTVGDKTASYTLTEEDVLESGKKAIIRPEFELVGDETLSGDIVATVNEYVSFDNHQGNKPTISLKAEAVYPATTLAFEHQYAYGKMELVGLPAEFNVTEVKLNLVGGGNTLNHTINGYSVEDNIFWFTTEAMEAVESFSVYASNGAETYYKEVTVKTAFAFEVGHVSAFRVKELVEKPADFNVQLTKITSMSNNVIRFEGDNAEDNITITFNPGLETLAAGHYDAVDQDWFNGGEWAWTDATALEVKNEFQGSSVDVNAAGGGEWYYNHNGVDVTVDGDVYTIVAHLLNYTSNGNQTVDFTYVGKLEVVGSGSEPEPEAPVFTSAYTYADAGTNDKKIFFEGGSLAQLMINVYGDCLNGNIWAEGEYTTEFVNNSLIFGGSSSKYDGENIKTIKVTVSHVAEGYHILFENVMGYDGLLLESATFTGTIDGMNTPAGTTPDPEPDPETPVASAKASLVTDTTFAGFNPYDVTFSFENGDEVIVRFNTSGKQYLHLGDWQTDNYEEPHYISDAEYNGKVATIKACNVAYESDAYVVTLSVYEYTNYATLNYTFTGAIKGLIAPEACDCFEEPEEDELPEFVIPGEGGTYTYDFRYTKLVDGLDASNGIRVKQDNGWIWDIKFNPGLSEITAGDYTAVQSFTTDDALEVDTYNGSVQYGDGYQFFYPDSYDEVSINVQKEGDYYCITLIGANGYSAVGKTYRLVYIGKIK